MKYPPVVSTLEEWLDGKFGLQGIDAVSCAFYLLSLLQRDEANDPETFYQYPCSKIVDDQTFSYWPRNSWSNWRLGYNNSLPAKCVSTPIQRYEIEHLGNDLSPSLNSNKSEGGDGLHQEYLFEKRSFSFPISEQGERCQKVFSVSDHPSIEKQQRNVNECKSIPWANGSACVGFCKLKLEQEGLEEKIDSSSTADNIVHEEAEDIWMTDLLETGNNVFLDDEKLLWNKEDNFFSWNTSEETFQTKEGNLKRNNYPESMKGVWEPAIFCKQVKGTTSVSMPIVGTDLAYNVQNPPELAEDKNLAQLIAKFDHSIEAIWDFGSADSFSYDIPDEQQSVSWSFYSSVSPPPNKFKAGQHIHGNWDSRSEENSFIHSGTNIINSIWSDQPLVNKSSSHAEYESQLIGSGVTDFNEEEQADLCCKLKVLLTTDQLLHNKFDFCDWKSKTSEFQKISAKNEDLHEVTEESSDILWNKFQTFPSVFSNINFREQFCQTGNLQNVKHENQQTECSCMLSCSPYTVPHIQEECQDSVLSCAVARKRNFSALNHNREDSSFTEVLPRSSLTNLHENVEIRNISSSQNNQTDNASPSSHENNNNNNNDDDKSGKEEEEDLLTSARTHFRPIQQENQEPPSLPVTSYADGTTFVISSDYAEVPFKRSDSGTLYLENDEITVTPKKYMEYKRTGDQLKCLQNALNKTGNKGMFVPKFCVRQLEKCCQTDDSDESSDETHSERIKQGCEEKIKQLNLFSLEDEAVKSVASRSEDNSEYASDMECKNSLDVDEDDDRMDEIFAQNARNDSVSKSLEVEMHNWNSASCKCNNNYMFSKNDSLRASGAGFLSEKEGLWEPVTAARVCQSRYSIWSCSPGPPTGPCPACETLPQDKKVQYSQLREELSEDGEQLLSDLSSLQPLQLNAGWLDDTLDQSVWADDLLPCASSRKRRWVTWGQCGEG